MFIDSKYVTFIFAFFMVFIAFQVIASDTENNTNLSVFEALAELKKDKSYPLYEDKTPYAVILKDLINRGIKILSKDTNKIEVKDADISYEMTYIFNEGMYVRTKTKNIMVSTTVGPSLNTKIEYCKLAKGSECSINQEKHFKKIIESITPKLSSLHIRYKKKNPDTEGAVLFEIKVLASGEVKSVDVINSEFNAPDLFKRLRDRLKRISFSGDEFEDTDFRFTINFK